MNTLRKLLGSSFALAGAVLGLSGCDVPGEHYRISATVDANGTLYTGSSVQRFRCHEGGGIWGSMDVSQCTVKGEAVVVDLKDRGALFLVFKGPHGDMSSMVRSVLRMGAGGVPPNPPPRWQLAPDEMPMMVTFRNLSDPKSVLEADPSDLSKTFGPGVSLDSVIVETTDDSVTWGKVYTALPWLKNIGDRMLDGRFGTSTNETSSRLQKSDFIYGE